MKTLICLLAMSAAPLAAQEPDPVAVLIERLQKVGMRTQSAEGTMSSVLMRQSPFSADGRSRGLRADLVEAPNDETAAPSDSTGGNGIQDLLYRRQFDHLEVVAQDWFVDPNSKTGRVEVWMFALTLDGELVSGACMTARIDGSRGRIETDKPRQCSKEEPSDAVIERHWKAVLPELPKITLVDL